MSDGADVQSEGGEGPTIFVDPQTRELHVRETALKALPEDVQAEELRRALGVLFKGVEECFEEAGEVKLRGQTSGGFLGRFSCPPSTGLTACRLGEDSSGKQQSFGCKVVGTRGMVAGISNYDEVWAVRGTEGDRRVLAYSEDERATNFSFGEGSKPKVGGVFRSVLDGLFAKLKITRPPRDPKRLRW